MKISVSGVVWQNKQGGDSNSAGSRMSPEIARQLSEACVSFYENLLGISGSIPTYGDVFNCVEVVQAICYMREGNPKEDGNDIGRTYRDEWPVGELIAKFSCPISGQKLEAVANTWKIFRIRKHRDSSWEYDFRPLELARELLKNFLERLQERQKHFAWRAEELKKVVGPFPA